MEDQIVNRVASSSLITFNLEDLYTPGERVVFDLKDQLFQGLVLKEKDYRDFIRSHDWSSYKDKHVAVICSADAIVPTWAYMLLATVLQPHAASVHFGSLEELDTILFKNALDKIDWEQYRDAKVVVKGCSKVDVPVAVYVDVTARLTPMVSSLMFGEPCSTVPLFKRKK